MDTGITKDSCDRLFAANAENQTVSLDIAAALVDLIRLNRPTEPRARRLY